MNHRLPTCVAIGVLLLTQSLRAAAPTQELLRSIQASTFEVVMKKPEKDPVSYEKPLPLELLPYIERTDPYQSMGTAFSLGRNQYVTAAHVILAGVDSQYGAPALRNTDGTIYLIDRILKFSLHQDFVVFSLQRDPAPQGFAVNREPKLTEPVLAVGNALGEGIVIRDGLYTSDTAEEQDGRWKWIRFSAAASPGNSGGPLLDKDGRVIGVVLRKSPNENLNFSLPIAQVLDAPDNKAHFDKRDLIALPYLQGTQTYRLEDSFDLPLTMDAFARAYQATISRHDERARTALLKTYAATLFPKGNGVESVLYAADANGYKPRLIAQDSDNSWKASSPFYSSVELGGDGSLSTGARNGVVWLRLVRPNSASDDGFYGDSKAFMDLALKGLNLRRPVGTDRVRITSLGSAQADAIHVDRYGRKWQERLWPVPFLNIYVQCLMLPTPDGYSGIVQYLPSSQRAVMQARGRLLTDQVDVSYTGTLQQWRSFLARRPLLPAAMGDVELDTAPNWTLRTKRFTFTALPSALSLTDKSVLSLTMGFVPQDQQVIWDIEGAWWSRDETRKASVGLWRRLRPPAEANRELRTAFDDMRAQRAPYNGSISRKSTSTYELSTVIEVAGTAAGKVSGGVLYGITWQGEQLDSTTSKSQLLKQLISTAQIAEKGVGENIEPTRPVITFPPGHEQAMAGLDAVAARVVSERDQTERHFGRDLRGRTISDDLNALIDWARVELANPDVDLLQVQQQQRTRSFNLGRYWATVPAATHNRDLWPSFLSLNHMPADTPHVPAVLAAEKAVLDSVRDGPTEQSALLNEKLHDAYVEERANAKSQIKLAEPDFRRRMSPCPAPTTAISASAKIAVLSMKRSPDDFYPVEVRNAYVEGRVVVAFVVSSEGCAIKFAIAHSSGSALLDNAALQFMETIEFQPAANDGKAIESKAMMPVKFKVTKPQLPQY